MADLKVRRLDDRIAAMLRARAHERGVSLEEEARNTLAMSVSRRRRAFARRAAMLRAAVGAFRAEPVVDTVALIRAERDAWG